MSQMSIPSSSSNTLTRSFSLAVGGTGGGAGDVARASGGTVGDSVALPAAGDRRGCMYRMGGVRL